MAKPNHFAQTYAVVAAFLIAGIGGIKVRLSSKRAGDFGLTQPSFLIMSSPQAQKVSYTQVENFRAKSRVHALVDSGLASPHGIAYDPNRNSLYIADLILGSIIRYELGVEACDSRSDGVSPGKWAQQNMKKGANGPDGDCTADEALEYAVVVKNDPVRIVEGVYCKWITVDDWGDVYFTDSAAKTVNRIDHSTIERLVSGIIVAGSLKWLTSTEVGVLSQADSSMKLDGSAADALHSHRAIQKAVTDSVITLYSKDTSSDVTSPAGITSDVSKVYWTNEAKGDGCSVGSGPAQLEAFTISDPVADEVARSRPLASNSESAQDVAVTYNAVVYSDKKGSIYALSQKNPVPVELTRLGAPRGVVWDGDDTVYVADMHANAVFSLACGRLTEQVPIAIAVNLFTPFGLAIIKHSDPAFRAAVEAKEGRTLERMLTRRSAAVQQRPVRSFLATVVVAWLAACAGL